MVCTLVLFIIYVIESEKTTLITQKILMCICYVMLKLQVFCSLFQLHSIFSYLVMGGNARRCSRIQNEIIASNT